MLDIMLVAFTTFVITIGPVDVAAIFAALTPRADVRHRRSLAMRATGIATVILLAFALGGQPLLHYLGISLPALQTAGGVLLFLIGVDMVFARESGGVSATEEEVREAEARPDIAVFPLATPLIAGPGAMSAVVLLMANAGDDLVQRLAVVAMLLVTLLLTLGCLLTANTLQRLLGITGMHVITRVMGVLLCALAVQFVFDGIAGSGLL